MADADFLLVDGHSMIFAWEELRDRHHRLQANARDHLIRLLTEYQDATGIKVVLVFDGAGQRAQEVTEPGGIQVFYAPSHGTADGVIERLVARYAGKVHLLVATDDRQEQQTVHALGGEFITAIEMASRLEAARRDLQSRVAATQRRGNRRPPTRRR